jgi:chromosome segregation ATPase
MQAYALCRRMTVLENYRVVSQSQADLETDLKQLDAKIEITEDPLVKREYQDSRRSLQERITKLESVSTQLDRVEAQLVSLSNELDGVVTQVVRLQAMGPQDAARYVPELVSKLRQEATQLKEFEREAVRI